MPPFTGSESASARPPGVSPSPAIFEVPESQLEGQDPYLKDDGNGNLQPGFEEPRLAAPPDPAISTETPAISTAASASAMRTGLIAGVAVGSFVILALVALLVFLYIRRKRNRRAPSSEFMGKENAPFRRIPSYESEKTSLGTPPLAYNPGRIIRKFK